MTLEGFRPAEAFKCRRLFMATVCARRLGCASLLLAKATSELACCPAWKGASGKAGGNPGSPARAQLLTLQTPHQPRPRFACNLQVPSVEGQPVIRLGQAG